ncbi:hypothetical protein Voc01_100920 [Virgisporangium ochraceum]|uniref:Uncharacterized protein n=1 Tax=Virgisporangium ochraceum TaxID=65505 RepID=A0A8J4EGU8_9ACTN|nr:hypothetical protein Voc01_100920 [Virgisporangium ochraceum]
MACTIVQDRQWDLDRRGGMGGLRRSVLSRLPEKQAAVPGAVAPTAHASAAVPVGGRPPRGSGTPRQTVTPVRSNMGG